VRASTVALAGAGCTLALLGTALCAGGAAWMYATREPASSFVGDQSRVVELAALDLNGERDAPLLVKRLEVLGVTARLRDVRREGATLEVDGARDVQAALDAVLPPMRVAFWSEADAEPAGRTKHLDTCVLPPCEDVTVDAPPALTGREIAEAALQPGEPPGIAIEFTPDGALLLEALTQRQAGRRVVVTLDDAVYCTPRVQGRVSGGRLLLSLGQGASPDPDAQRRSAETLLAGLQTGPLAGRWEVLRVEAQKPTGFRQ